MRSAAFDFEDEMRVTVIATGFDQKPVAEEAPKASGAVAGTPKATADDDIFAIFKR